MKNEIDFSLKKFEHIEFEHIEFEHTWPEIFDTQNLSNRRDAALCADALIAWANCSLGCRPHRNFSKVMAEIGQRLDIVPLPENFMKWSNNWLRNNRLQS